MEFQLDYYDWGELEVGQLEEEGIDSVGFQEIWFLSLGFLRVCLSLSFFGVNRLFRQSLRFYSMKMRISVFGIVM